MNNTQHYIVYTDNESNINLFTTLILKGELPELLVSLKNLKGDVLNKSKINDLIFEEEVHDIKIATKNTSQSLKSMSSGEQKKIVLEHILSQKPDFILLDSPFDNLDISSVQILKDRLKVISEKTCLILLISRQNDSLSFIKNQFILSKDNTLLISKKIEKRKKTEFLLPIPKPHNKSTYSDDVLIDMKNITVSFEDRIILKNINWTINQNEFWQLKGKNGSGKTTLLSMITGENSKGYGQELYLFGNKKGTGESIWDIKKKIGYYSPTLTHNFNGLHSVEHMLISGLNDSIGLYKHPTELQRKLADEWLDVLDMKSLKNSLFIDLTTGNQRLVMVARAMIKQPLLLILDEPTENLDDKSAYLFVDLVNKISKESTTTVLFVSHRDEPGLKPKKIFELQKTENGATGSITN
ncbi:ATP-binding cassette domain-containing protein [Cellulophaga sp. HaHaR_3_176]|uniref:ATP-binding cassette domain-containing protein n=1 Tax=Cellulophaga sp. HaHaR_3_176 TaxID=1942464 RepID=UPI001C1FDC58|nr:ATP-binding cassette domain-containing protein [Cellulophaga sp. HaHaR_3_176]QWX82869.1 ATP-binding cassette domain-containing protein [Cellulophaga sp. HaHaR_3_176]